MSNELSGRIRHQSIRHQEPIREHETNRVREVKKKRQKIEILSE